MQQLRHSSVAAPRSDWDSVAATTVPSLSAELQQQLDRLPDWQVVDGHHLHREFRFRDFLSALAWVNQAGAICEAQGHHADFLLRWGSVRVEIFTHDSDGLSDADPRLALALDQLPL